MVALCILYSIYIAALWPLVFLSVVNTSDPNTQGDSVNDDESLTTQGNYRCEK